MQSHNNSMAKEMISLMLRYLEVKEAILERITRQEPNTRLPSRKKLCDEFMISRTTIDRAISDLLKDGYLYSVAGSGTFVADLTVNDTPVRTDVINIGVIIPNILHDTYPGILRGIQDATQNRNINVVVCNTDNDFDKQRSSLRRMLNTRVNGLLVIPAIVNGEAMTDKYYQDFVGADIPVIFCNRRIDGLRMPLVCSNNFYGGYLATKHLLEHGYDKIAFLSVLHYQTSTARYYGYQAALWEKGLEVDPDKVVQIQDYSNVSIGYNAMKRLLDKGMDINGVFAFNDQIACGAINAINEHHLRVSDDIGVIGYDNTALCSVPPEALTSVSFKKYEIGYKAAELLIEKIMNPDAEIPFETVFCPQIHVRESCLGQKA